MKFTTFFGLRSQTTRLQDSMSLHHLPVEQAFHLLWNPSQGRFKPTDNAEHTAYTLHFVAPVKVPRFSAGLIPVHSPLLRESLLVSFPPLTDMLKFSG